MSIAITIRNIDTEYYFALYEYMSTSTYEYDYEYVLYRNVGPS